MRLEKDKTGIYRHRHWRGLKDTLYDYGQWLKLWGILIKWAVKHPVINVKALFRYRWMFNYLTAPAFFDRLTGRMGGEGLRASRNNLNTIADLVTVDLEKTLLADLNLRPNSKDAQARAKKIIYMDELIPKLVTAGFPQYETILAQAIPAYLPSLIVQHSPIHYIEASESYGLPADVCPLPSLEAGIAIEDDFPKFGCCFISCNMPCDGSIMTTTLQDRRFNLPTFPLNIPLRWKREDTQEYAVEEMKACIAFLEEQTGEKCDWDALKAACERVNEQSRMKMEKWELNRTDTPPHIGGSNWIYRIFSYEFACANPKAIANDRKVNAILKKPFEEGRDPYQYPQEIRHRAVVWNTPANMYAHFNGWIAECWGVQVVCDMIDLQGTEIIDTSTRESMLYGLAKMVQGSTMRVHTKGGWEVIMDDLWVKVEEYNADMVVMFDQISCKGVAALKGAFEEQARARGVRMVWVEQDLMDPTTVSRRTMRDQVNKYMETVMGEKPVDADLVDFDDSESW